MDTNKTTSFEDKFNRVLKPSIDKFIDSEITNSMSDVALEKFIENKKNNVDHLLAIRTISAQLNS